MINDCDNCGEYRADKIIDPNGPFAICPLCGHKKRFRQLPLFIICGPSAAGKSTVCDRITGTIEEVVILDADILWRPAFNKPENNYRDFFETWLRLGKNIGQSGRPLLLFCAGAIPQNMEPRIDRRYFSEIHYLALVCEDETLIERLKRRQSPDEAFIAEQVKFNHWLKEQPGDASASIKLLDTTNGPIDKTVDQVLSWIMERVA